MSYTTLMILFIVQIVNIFQYFFTTYLSAMNQIKELFRITVVANTTLNAALIPVIGISGAAAATLVTMALNAFLSRRALARKITLRVEASSLLNIFKASIVMGAVVGGYRWVVPLSNVWLALVPVVLGGAVYGVLVLKFDRKIYEELKGIMMQMDVTWPGWL